MGVRSESLRQALQMCLCACLFCVFTFHGCLLLMQGQLPGPAEVLCAQTWAGEATLPCRVTEPSVQQSTPEGAVLQFLLCPRCPEWATWDSVQGKADFLCMNQRLGFMDISLLPPSSGCVTAADFPVCTGHSLELYLFALSLWKCLLKCGSWRDLLKY